MARKPLFVLLLCLAGKINALPLTAQGIALAEITCKGKITLGHNAVEYHDCQQDLLSPYEAQTIGNVTMYTRGYKPDDVGPSPYTGEQIVTGKHEEIHTFQMEALGILQGPAYIIFLSRMEAQADHLSHLL